MLTEKYDIAALKEKFCSLKNWKPFPAASDRKGWDDLQDFELNRKRKEWLINRAESFAGKPWPELSASLFMEFMRNGNRSRYEKPYFERRQRLGVLAVAECMEGKGRFLDAIIDGLWLICDEASWCVPAHEGRKDTIPQTDPLLDHADPTVALFSCETAMVLAECVYLLRDRLDAVSPQIVRRVTDLVECRIFAPLEQKKEFLWYDGHNNWTPWCCSNILGAAMYLMDDADRLAAMAHLLMGYCDSFIAGYAPDGGCSEGPGYWGVAAGALLIFLELLFQRSAGAVSIYDEPLIREMGQFIVRVHLDGPWFTNFADAGARISPHRGRVYRYGERVNSPEMKNLVLLSMRGWQAENEVHPVLGSTGLGNGLNVMLRELFWVPADAEPEKLPRPRTVWLPDLQVMAARETEEPGKGMILAAKAGHNDECHNHNDVGQFIIVRDGEPFVVDAGVQRYVRNTFRDEFRYAMWHCRSAGHNVPVINGTEQMHGKEFAAQEVSCKEIDGARVMNMDMAGAYPAGGKIEKAERTLTLDGGNAVILEDNIKVRSDTVAVEVTLYSPCSCSRPGDGQVVLAGEKSSLSMAYDPDVLDVRLEEFALEDEKMKVVWGDRLFKIIIAASSPGPAMDYSVTFSKVE